MAIDACNKFVNTMINRLSDYELKSTREINDVVELEELMEVMTNGGFTIGIIKLIYHFVDAKATEYVSSNGLIFLDSQIMYKEKKETQTIQTVRQFTLMTAYQKKALINIVFENSKMAIQELLVSSKMESSILDVDKNINFSRTIIYVDGQCGSVFESFSDIKSNNLLLERYKQYYPMSKYEDTEKDLLRLCGCGTRYLEIVYGMGQPIFAQLSSKYKVEMAGYNPSSSVDAKCIVNRLNEEVDAITSYMNFLFNEHDKFVMEVQSKKEQKRLVKTEK